jgi:hypothetical protein
MILVEIGVILAGACGEKCTVGNACIICVMNFVKIELNWLVSVADLATVYCAGWENVADGVWLILGEKFVLAIR